jgi:hypothetical protein
LESGLVTESTNILRTQESEAIGNPMGQRSGETETRWNLSRQMLCARRTRFAKYPFAEAYGWRGICFLLRGLAVPARATNPRHRPAMAPQSNCIFSGLDRRQRRQPDYDIGMMPA